MYGEEEGEGNGRRISMVDIYVTFAIGEGTAMNETKLIL